MNTSISVQQVVLQENGIIRDSEGKFIGRIVHDVDALCDEHYRRGYTAGLHKADVACREVWQNTLSPIEAEGAYKCGEAIQKIVNERNHIGATTQKVEPPKIRRAGSFGE